MARSRRSRSALAPGLATGLATSLMLCGLLATGAACSDSPKIPGTEIPDTPENHEILNTLERYRTAFIRRDAAQVLALAHKTYLDEAGTLDPDDDVTYEELGPMLRARLSQLDSLRFTIDYVDIHVRGDRAVVRVWIDASFKMKPILDANGIPRDSPPYFRKQDHAEFELLRENDGWLIVRGL